MNTEITTLESTNTIELELEIKYKSIALTPTIKDVMLEGGSPQKFSKKYKTFTEQTPTPSQFSELQHHIQSFLTEYDFIDEQATNAGIYLTVKVWEEKYKNKSILNSEIYDAYHDKQELKNQARIAHQAINRAVKGKAIDSYEAGFKASFTALFELAGAKQLKLFIEEAEQEQAALLLEAK